MSLYALYLRKSRSDDPEKSVEETLRRHREILDKYAIENGIDVKPEDIYEEVVSGESLYSRPEMLRLLESVENSLTDTYQQPYDQQPQPNITINQLEYKQGLSISPKSKIITLILVIFLGFLGIHRFYAGKVGTGIIWFLTAGFFVFGWIYDIIKIASGTFTDGMGFTIRK